MAEVAVNDALPDNLRFNEIRLENDLDGVCRGEVRLPSPGTAVSTDYITLYSEA